MAIKGLTDRQATFPQVGVLRKGAVKPDKGPGRDLNHFRFDSDDADAVRVFNECYGDEPRQIFAYVPYRTTAENFEAWKEDWVASSLKHRCDGETMVRWLTPQGTYSTEARPCPGGCKQVGRLKIIVPQLKRLAFVTVLTTSIHDIIEINSNLQALEAARGDLRGIPLIIRRAPREISTPGPDGKRVRREKWLISVEAQPQWVEQQLQVAAAAAMPSLATSQAPALALPAWDGDDDDDVVVSNGAMTKQQFKARWESSEDGGGITYDDIADCAIAWGLTDSPRTKDINRVRDMVLKAAGIEEAKESQADPKAIAAVETALKHVAMHVASGNAAEAKKIFDRDFAGLDFARRQEALLSIRPKMIEAVDAVCVDLGKAMGDEVAEQILTLNAGTTAIDDIDTVLLINTLVALKRELKGAAKAVAS